MNPFRYRGYYYDDETGLYYLQSRYYDPETGRFINGDMPEFAIIGQTVLGHNLYAYCENQPVSRIDYSGHSWVSQIALFVTGGALYSSVALLHYFYNRTKTINGYIYNQNTGNASKLWFGFFKSSYNGCGWIATYNATLMLGKRVEPHDIIRHYELTGAVLYGVFGIQPYAITHFFRFKGYKVTVTYNTKKFDEIAKKNSANIIWYWHNSGAHYVALKWNGKSFIGYNTYRDSAGLDNWGKSISSRLNSKSWKATLLISVSKK